MQTPPDTRDTPDVPPASGFGPAEERACLVKIAWRLLPLLFFCYVIAYIDRINVGFAKLHLRDVLGVDGNVFDSMYGVGAGLFFIGYFIFEVPSNLILQRVGARRWIARIMVVKDKTGNNVAALAFLGCALLAMAVLTLAVPKVKSSDALERNS